MGVVFQQPITSITISGQTASGGEITIDMPGATIDPATGDITLPPVPASSRELEADYTPTNYTPAQVDAEGNDKVSAHLKGIDAQLILGGGGGDVVPYQEDLSFNGTDLVKDVDVSAIVTDARKAVWFLHDNSNNFEKIFCQITATAIDTVRIETNIALALGTYRLIGLENIS